MEKNYQPISKRTRKGTSIANEMMFKANKRARVKARNDFLKKKEEEDRVMGMFECDVSDDDDDDDDEVVAIEIDKETFERNSRSSTRVVEENDEASGCSEGKGKEIMVYEGKGDDESDDDSLMIVGEGYNASDIDMGEGDDDECDGDDHDHHNVGGSKGVQEEKFMFCEDDDMMRIFSSSSSSEEDESDTDYRELIAQISSPSSLHESTSDDDHEDHEDHDDHEDNDQKGKKRPRVDRDDGRMKEMNECVDNVERNVRKPTCGSSPLRYSNADDNVEKNVEKNVRMPTFVDKGVQCDLLTDHGTCGSSPLRYSNAAADDDDSLDAMDECDDGLIDPVCDQVQVHKKEDDSGKGCVGDFGRAAASSSQPPAENIVKAAPEIVRVNGGGRRKGKEVEHDDEHCLKVLGVGGTKDFVLGLEAELPKWWRTGDTEVDEQPQSSERPHRSSEFLPREEQMRKRTEPEEVENAIFNEIMEKRGDEGLVGIVSNANGGDDEIQRKFRFGVEEVVTVEKTEEELELEILFKELYFCLGVCDIGLDNHLDANDEEEVMCNNAILQDQFCYNGKHYIIEDEEIGLRCKFCGYVQLEIRDVTPGFGNNPFGRSRGIFARFTDDDASASNSHILEANHDIGASLQANGTRGTVWDLIPGTKNTLYEHQIKGFEFMWRNIEGGIELDQLDKPSRFGLGGCMICHAPGTGKTRLAIIFLQSFVKQYPLAKPIILAPSSILLTWEEEFAKLRVEVPFLNLNSHNKQRISDKAYRLAKLCEWLQGKGILGISYTLFEKLAGERKNINDNVKRALLKKSGILVLDEGHTPRNEGSKLWKVLSEVDTKRRIILSGTPFQNNIEELLNTMSIVREEFGYLHWNGQYVNPGCRSKTDKKKHFYKKGDEERFIEHIKHKMKPYVDVHKGEILRKALRGLFHSVIVLKPSEIQKTYLHRLDQMKNGLQKDHLVSIAAVHPSLLIMSEKGPDIVDKTSLEKHKRDWNAGVKIKFLFELIKLIQGEKVLVFSQFIIPLTLIADLLMSAFKWKEGREFLYMDGRLSSKIRQSLIKKFNDPLSNSKVLLASTKACCEGIHLVGASRVVLLDVVWNPSVERQAISRAYRLGQKKDVFVYHLITSGTHEEEKICRQVAKDRLSELVFKSSDGETGKEMKVSEDRVLEEMIQHPETKNMFEKIIRQPKADKLIESFGPLNL